MTDFWPWPFHHHHPQPVRPPVPPRPTIEAVHYEGHPPHHPWYPLGSKGKESTVLLYSVQASVADPSVTARTLTITITPSGSGAPNAPTTGPLADGVTLNVGDSAELTLVDTDPTGDSLPSAPFTFVGAAPPPPGTVPATPSISGVTYVSGP
jgi:hypothetical protein